MKPIFFPLSPCLIEPKTVILAQLQKAETEFEPKWLNLRDAHYQAKPTLLRLRRSRGMRHTEANGTALTGCVAHRNKQDICVPQMSEPTTRAVGDLRGHPLTPGTERMI